MGDYPVCRDDIARIIPTRCEVWLSHAGVLDCHGSVRSHRTSGVARNARAPLADYCRGGRTDSNQRAEIICKTSLKWPPSRPKHAGKRVASLSLSWNRQRSHGWPNRIAGLPAETARTMSGSGAANDRVARRTRSAVHVLTDPGPPTQRP